MGPAASEGWDGGWSWICCPNGFIQHYDAMNNVQDYIILQKKRPRRSRKLNDAITRERRGFVICSAPIVVYGNLAFWYNIIHYSANYSCSFDRGPASDVAFCLLRWGTLSVKTGAFGTCAPFYHILSRLIFSTSMKSRGEEPILFFHLNF